MPCEEEIAISARQIPPADAAGEENIAADEELLRLQIKAETAWRMAGHFEDLELQAEKVAFRCRLDQQIRLRRFDIETKPELPEEGGVGDHRDGVRVTSDLAAEAAFDFRHVGHVVVVTMGEQTEASAATPRASSHSQAPSGASKRMKPSGASRR